MPVLLHVYNIMPLVGCNKYKQCKYSRWCNYSSCEDCCICVFSWRHWKKNIERAWNFGITRYESRTELACSVKFILAVNYSLL